MENITISNLYKIKIIATVSSAPTDPTAGHQHSWYPSIPSLLYPYLFPVWVHTPRTHHTRSFFLVLLYFPWKICESAYVHTGTFSRNIWSHASLHARTHSKSACTLSRHICSHASASIRARASASIRARTSVYMFVRAHTLARIRVCAPTSICACDGCSIFVCRSGRHTHMRWPWPCLQDSSCVYPGCYWWFHLSYPRIAGTLLLAVAWRINQQIFLPLGSILVKSTHCQYDPR